MGQRWYWEYILLASHEIAWSVLNTGNQRKVLAEKKSFYLPLPSSSEFSLFSFLGIPEPMNVVGDYLCLGWVNGTFSGTMT